VNRPAGATSPPTPMTKRQNLLTVTLACASAGVASQLHPQFRYDAKVQITPDHRSAWVHITHALLHTCGPNRGALPTHSQTNQPYEYYLAQQPHGRGGRAAITRPQTTALFAYDVGQPADQNHLSFRTLLCQLSYELLSRGTAGPLTHRQKRQSDRLYAYTMPTVWSPSPMRRRTFTQYAYEFGNNLLKHHLRRPGHATSFTYDAFGGSPRPHSLRAELKAT